MKRNIIFFIVLLMLLTLAACSQAKEPPQGKDHPYDAEAVLLAKIMDIKESSILLANMTEDAGPADIYSINGGGIEVMLEDGRIGGRTALKKGMLVEVAFGGEVLESFPMQFGNIEGIIIKSQGDDIAGLYRTVIDDLYKVDPGLNNNINILAFDFTEISNLTESEKAALIHMIGGAYNMETVTGTYEELSEQGYIDKENLYFEKGLLFTILDEPMSQDSFTFNAIKWRSGLGAFFYNNCIAKKSKMGWNYTIGSEAIS